MDELTGNLRVNVNPARPSAAALAALRSTTPPPEEEAASGSTVANGARGEATSALLSRLDERAREEFGAAGTLVAKNGTAANDPEADGASFEQRFAELAADPDAFHALMGQVYGSGYDAVAAEGLRARALEGDFGWLPRVEYVDADVLGGAHGAYDAASDTVYIDRNLRGTALGKEVLAEEVGHALDARLNGGADTAGDEGELFRRLLSGEALGTEEINAIRAEDDSGTIVIDGKSRAVEFWNPIKWVRDEIVEPVVDFVEDEIVEPVVEFVEDEIVEPIVEHVVEPVVDTVKGLGEDALVIIKDLVQFPFDLAEIGLQGVGEALGELGDGDLGGFVRELVGTVGDLGSATLAQGSDTVVLTLNAAVTALDTLTGAATERPLSPEELAYLRPIYGDSIDYDAVTIRSGGIKESVGEHLNLRSHVVGNDVFLTESNFNDDGSLTDNGLVTLGHELGHVWQFQNLGPEYITEAIYAQVTEGDEGVGTGGAYDWVAAAERGERFEDMNPESQAELASFIGQAVNDRGELDRANLEALIQRTIGDDSFVVSDDLFDTVSEAHDILRGID